MKQTNKPGLHHGLPTGEPQLVARAAHLDDQQDAEDQHQQQRQRQADHTVCVVHRPRRFPGNSSRPKWIDFFVFLFGIIKLELSKTLQNNMMIVSASLCE